MVTLDQNQHCLIEEISTASRVASASRLFLDPEGPAEPLLRARQAKNSGQQRIPDQEYASTDDLPE
jgi:hypothetical protein